MNVLEKILEEIDRLNEPYFVGYIDKYKVKEIVRSHIEELLKCGECSRRKWYQKGCEDGKKDNGWISVEERLPEKTDYYLVQLSRKLPNEDYSDRVVVLFNGEEKEFECYANLIIAWRPLPERYKGGDSNA